MTDKKEFIIVCLISVSLAICANFTYFFLVFQTPPGYISLGITSYWQDYFYYLSQVVQGAHGAILNNNLYTSELTTPTLLYWCNLLYGRIGNFFGLSPVSTFHISNIVLDSCMLVGAYVLFKKVFPQPKLAGIAFFFFTFSTSLINRLPKSSPVPFWPFELWRVPNFMFHRLSTVPNHITQTVLWLVLLYLLFKPLPIKLWVRITFIIVVTALTTLLHPVMVGLTVIMYTAAIWIVKKSRKLPDTLALVFGFGVTFAYTILAFQNNPYIQSRIWENNQQVYTTILFFLKSIGPIVPLVLLGLFVRRKTLTAIERLGVLLIITCYGVFLFPGFTYRIGILNTRLIFPGLYIFLGWFAACGLDSIASWISSHTNIKKYLMTNFLIVLFFVTIAPTLIWEVKQQIPDVHAFWPYFYFAPKSLNDAYRFLEKREPYTDVVLASPNSQIDVRIPAFTGHQTVTGHPLMTVHAKEKDIQAKQFFFLSMDKELVLSWLSKERVTYVFFTILDGNKQEFEKAYPFLKSIYQTDTAAVYVIEK